MGERLLQPPDEVRAEARHLARAAEGVDRDRLAWIGSGGQVGRATLLALLASGVKGKVAAWASKSYGRLVDVEHRDQVVALTAAAVEPDGRYFGICDPDQRDRVVAVVRASAEGLHRWTGKTWDLVPEDLAPVGLPYRELDDDVLPDALTACAAGQSLLLRAPSPRAFLGRRSTLTASAGRVDGVYAVVDDVDTSAVLTLIKVDGQAQYRRAAGRWVPDEWSTLPYLTASGAPLAYVGPIDLPGLLRAYDDHEAVFPMHAAADTLTQPKAAGLAVKAADTGRVLMLQRAMTPDDPAAGDWEFPGGHLEDGEEPYDGATREWAEETGMPVPDDGELTGAWASPDGVYQGHVLTVPSEFDPTDGRDQVTNPDDPDGDQVESIAWWEPNDLVDNPAVRTELQRDLTDSVLPAIAGEDQGDEVDEPPGAVTGDGITAAGPYRYRHGWIPVAGALFKNAEQKRQHDSLSKRGQLSYRSHRAAGENHGKAFAHAFARHGLAVNEQRRRAATDPLAGIGDTDEHGVLHYRGSLGVDRAAMPQLSGTVNGEYQPSSKITPQFLDELARQGVDVTSKNVAAESLRPTQTTGDPAKIRQMADRFKSGASTAKPIVISSDNRVLDGHHNWAGQRLADVETGTHTPMPVHQVNLPMSELLKRAAHFAASKGIASRGHGEFANPTFASAAPVITAGDTWLEEDEAFTGDDGITAGFWDPRKHPRGYHGRFGFGSRHGETAPTHERTRVEDLGRPERFGPPDTEQLSTSFRRPAKTSPTGRFGEHQKGTGQYPYGGRFGIPKGEMPQHQPLTDEQYQAHTAAVEKALEDAIARGENTDAKYGINVDAGLWQPERAQVHKQIANDIYDKQAKTAKSTGDALIMGGLGGAGKSTVLKNHLGLDPKDWVTVNPDDVKEEMIRRGLVPDVKGLSPMEASALIHEESSHIANLLAARALHDKKNIIYDITMSSKGSVQKRLKKLADAGYKKPQGVFVDIPVETSVQRALGRHRHGLEEHRQGSGHGGRYVPPSVIRKSSSSTSNSANRDVFDALAPQFGSQRIFDTSGQGAPRELPARGGLPGWPKVG